jgi:hypothetical protein
MDIDAIKPGVDFVEMIERRAAACRILLVVIGKRWLAATDRDGQRRLDNAHDFVRLEIASALRNGVWTIPVLVEGATMPRAQDLPRPLIRLARRNAFQLTDIHWRTDVEELSTFIAAELAKPIAEQEGDEPLDLPVASVASEVPPLPAVGGTGVQPVAVADSLSVIETREPPVLAEARPAASVSALPAHPAPDVKRQRRRWPLLAGVGAAVVAVAFGAVVVAGGLIPRPDTATAGPAGNVATVQPSAPTGPGETLLRADNPGDPSLRIFAPGQITTRISVGNGVTAAMATSWRYNDQGLVVLTGPPTPAVQNGQVIVTFVGAPDAVDGDFAVEARVRATKSVAQALYGLRYRIDGNNSFGFYVSPGAGTYRVTKQDNNVVTQLAAGRAAAIQADGAENLIRMEVRGDAMTVLVNGQSIPALRDASIARRGGRVGILAGTMGNPADGEAETTFAGFRVSTLPSAQTQ